jgi:hypothetical protein
MPLPMQSWTYEMLQYLSTAQTRHAPLKEVGQHEQALALFVCYKLPAINEELFNAVVKEFRASEKETIYDALYNAL